MQHLADSLLGRRTLLGHLSAVDGSRGRQRSNYATRHRRHLHCIDRPQSTDVLALPNRNRVVHLGPELYSLIELNDNNFKRNITDITSAVVVNVVGM